MSALSFAASAASAATYGGRVASLLFGAAGAVVLGEFVFNDFEIPARITWGGTQQMTVHKLPGGRRQIDAMGRDDAPLGWEGVFLSIDADARALALDEMRISGQPQTLAFGSQVYTVIVSDFQAEYIQPGQIGYRIQCTVLRDDSAAPEPSFISTAVQVLADINWAVGVVSAIVSPPSTGTPDPAPAQASSAAAAQSGFIKGSAAQATAASDLTALDTSMQAGVTASGAVLATAATQAPAGSLVASVIDLEAVVAQAATLALLAAATPFVARARVNAVQGAV